MIKTVPNDQRDSVRTVLSVRRQRARFARPSVAFGLDSLIHGHTQSHFETSPILGGWSFGIKEYKLMKKQANTIGHQKSTILELLKRNPEKTTGIPI